MLVVDASALTEMLVDGPSAPVVAEHVIEHDLAAPHVVDLEVLDALRRYGQAGKVSPERVDGAILDFFGLAVDRYPHDVLLPRIWFLRDNFTPYDAAYLALAESLADDGIPLLTTDARFARAARKHTDVEVLLAA